MRANQKVTGRSMSVVRGVISGIISSLSLTILGTVLTATLIHWDVIEISGVGYGAMITLLLSAWLGAAVAWHCVHRKKFLLCGLTGGGYYVSLLSITALLFGGQYQGMGVTALLILAGVMGSAITQLRGQRQMNVAKRFIRG